jgi:hypothetical protein
MQVSTLLKFKLMSQGLGESIRKINQHEALPCMDACTHASQTAYPPGTLPAAVVVHSIEGCD